MTVTENKPDYAQFYLEHNPADAARYRRTARDYARKLGPLLAGAGRECALNLGCGSGLLANYLAGAGFGEVVGVDLDERLVALARQNMRGNFACDDVIHYAANYGREFEVVFMLNLLEHIPRNRTVEFLRPCAGA